MSHTSGVKSRASGPRRQPNRGPRRSADNYIVRALALLLAMTRSQRGVRLKQFAEERGYPLSAVYRDREVLRRAGVPIDAAEGGRYKLADTWLPPAATGASREEMLALFVARRLAPGLRGTRIARHLDALWAKLAGPAGQVPLTFGDEAGLSIPTLAAIDYAPHAGIIDLLSVAQRERRAVWIRYRRPDGDETERVIEPGFLHWDGRLETLYVPSWCRLRDGVRVFAVHRIRDARLTDDTFAPRPETRRSALDKAFRIWMSERVEPVVIQFAPRISGEIRERRRHASQRLVELADGGVVLHLEVAEPEELTRWLLGYGADAQVLAPRHLAERLHALHVAAAAVAPSAEGLPAAAALVTRAGAKGREARTDRATARDRKGARS